MECSNTLEINFTVHTNHMLHESRALAQHLLFLYYMHRHVLYELSIINLVPMILYMPHTNHKFLYAIYNY